MLRDDQNLDSDQSKSDESINLYAIFFKYFVYWPWFVASVLICLVGCYIYLRYQAPVYNVSSAVLIKENDKRSGNSANNPLGALQDLGMFSMTNNFDNEVEILRSRTLIKKVVNDLGLYISIPDLFLRLFCLFGGPGQHGLQFLHKSCHLFFCIPAVSAAEHGQNRL